MTATETSSLVPPGTWKADPAHSSVEFEIKHLMMTTVRGWFREFEGTFTASEEGDVGARAVIKTASIDTNQPKRDEHLRSADFFDAENHPEITFESTKVEPTGGEGEFKVDGMLTIRDVARGIVLDATVDGRVRDPWGQERIGLTLRGRLTPTDYDVNWNQELETGGNLVGDKAELTITVSAIPAE